MRKLVILRDGKFQWYFPAAHTENNNNNNRADTRTPATYVATFVSSLCETHFMCMFCDDADVADFEFECATPNGNASVWIVEVYIAKQVLTFNVFGSYELFNVQSTKTE